MNTITKLCGVLASCAVLFIPVGVSAGDIKQPRRKAPPVRNWSLLINTYWIVYPENLPAFELQGTALGTIGRPKTDPPTISPLQDQTVYYIKGYDPSGYFWGTFSVELVDPTWDNGTHPQSSCGTLLSPITPAGDLIISSTTDQGGEGDPPTQNWGTGKMVWMNVDGVDQWTMQNWKVGGYVHWAYMIQVRPGHKYWNNLPYSHRSVQDFLAPCYLAPNTSVLNTNNWDPVNPPPNPPRP